MPKAGWAQPYAGNRGKMPGKAPKGAKRRAAVALVGKKAAAAMTDAELFAFWSAHTMRVPPPLRTSFGNYTCVNSVVRFTFTTSTTVNRYIWVPWSPSAVAALWSSAATSSTLNQVLYSTLTTGSPTSIRPLRMSFSVENITQLVNTMGSIRVYSLDTSVLSSWGLGILPQTGVNPATSLDTQLGALVDASPDTVEVPIADLTKAHEWVSAPASYPLYNTYYDFIQLTNNENNSGIYSSDMYNLMVQSSVNDAYPGVAQNYTTGVYGDGLLGGAPTMRGFIISIPATSTAQSLRFEFHRQDGARYPANSLGHTFSSDHPNMSGAGEDKFMSLSNLISKMPGRCHPVDIVSNFAGAAGRLNSALALGGEAVRLGGKLESAVGSLAKGMAAFGI